MGLAEGPDGSLYISESEQGKIWRVMYKGARDKFGAAELVHMEKRKQLPHIKTPDEVHDNLDHGRIAAGEKLYRLHCAACHLNDGKGDGTRFPPINNSATVMGEPGGLIDLLLHGKEGVVEVKGEIFEGAMPAFNYLENEEIAQILTYIRKNLGNNASSVTAFEIANYKYKLTRKAEGEQDNDAML